MPPAGEAASQVVDERLVGVAQVAPGGVGQHLLGHAGGEALVLGDGLAQLGRAVEGDAVSGMVPVASMGRPLS